MHSNENATRIGAILTGMAVIIWSGWYLHRKNGTTIFLILCILSVFTGGGSGKFFFY